MCLAAVTYKKECFEGVGYKSIEVEDGHVVLRSGHLSELTCSFGKWYKAVKETINSDDGKRYQTGFHVYLSKNGAEAYKNHWGGELVRVSYRKARTIGDQRGHVVVIADEIKFEEILG